MADSSSVFTDRRAEAALCGIAAAELLALILLLAGAIPNVRVLDTVLSVAAPPLCLGAFAVLFTQLRPSVWAVTALLFQVVNTRHGSDGRCSTWFPFDKRGPGHGWLVGDHDRHSRHGGQQLPVCRVGDCRMLAAR
jgi:hypothetical protein